ncbi:serine--tRNA ligase-like protein [Dinothrombium tinctorium]|uniref:serine--tRNA ligase n=1 Tax=Dinothrombium tinctorium TaxID=1965070 RepID=A0A443RP42_9ACAR|nr:serine--tRNA ligase-like protein [Dinothrombium tinctorium]
MLCVRFTLLRRLNALNSCLNPFSTKTSFDWSSLKSNSLLASDYHEYDYWLNDKNFNEIVHNLETRRKPNFDTLANQCRADGCVSTVLEKHLHLMPNKLNEKWQNYTLEQIANFTAKDLTVKVFGTRKKFDFRTKTAEHLLKKFGSFFDYSNGDIGLYGGERAYVLVGDGALLQNAIINWALDELRNTFEFTLISVPHIVNEEIVAACGFNPKGERTQIHKLRGIHENVEDLPCLIGTSEIPLAAFHIGHTFEVDELPKKYCCVSRCYRSETDQSDGLYRVQYFTKVEMFALTEKGKSAEMLQHFINVQEYLFSQLGLLCRLIDMPPHELGRPANRKFDIEAWIPSKRICGEISSASDCTDYQSRRFNIKYRKIEPDYERNEPFTTEYVSTVNGTAVALPRLLIPLIEYNQTKEKKVILPQVLHPYMEGKSVLEMNDSQ